jgi:hypothetical protein
MPEVLACRYRYLKPTGKKNADGRETYTQVILKPGDSVDLLPEGALEQLRSRGNTIDSRRLSKTGLRLAPTDKDNVSEVEEPEEDE